MLYSKKKDKMRNLFNELSKNKKTRKTPKNQHRITRAVKQKHKKLIKINNRSKRK